MQVLYIFIICANRGVVQLFNAVKKQQKIVSQRVEEAGPSARKQEQAIKSVSKGQFMDLLKGGAANVVREGTSDLQVRRVG